MQSISGLVVSAPVSESDEELVADTELSKALRRLFLRIMSTKSSSAKYSSPISRPRWSDCSSVRRWPA